MSTIDKIGYLINKYYLTFLDGIAATLILAIVGTFVGLFIGIFLALGRNITYKPTDSIIVKILKRITKAFVSCYVNFFRGTPMMVQAMIFFLAVPVWTDLPTSWIFNGYMICGLIVITLNTAAYMAEIVRSGLNGVELGQIEGARSLGMSYFKTMFTIIMPQALKNSLPTILNEYIVNVKDSSVLNVIGLTELYASVSLATSVNYFTVAGYIIIAVIYLVLTLFATLLVKLISRKLNGDKVFINPFKHSKLEIKEAR